MARVRIAHASISETGTINGKKGDQTGKEVCIRDYYARGWNVVLRPISTSFAESTATSAEILAKNNNVGYGQADRNSAYKSYKKVKDLSKIALSNIDCSAFVTLCAIASGCKGLEYSDNAPTTRTMRKAFVDSGYYIALTDKKYLDSSDYLKRGDVLVKEGTHTVMVLDNGAKTTETKKETTKGGEQYFPKCGEKETSIVNALQGLKIDSGFANRQKIAQYNGVAQYAGTYEQNLRLLEKLKQGKLKKPTK